MLAAEARAETFKLALKRLPPRGENEFVALGGWTLDRAPAAPQDPAVEHVWRAISPQSFFMQIMAKPTSKEEKTVTSTVIRGNPQEAEFHKLVRKEHKYNSDQPLRGVITLGSDRYCFALDAKDKKSGGYQRLYFDRKHQGDLAAEQPIDANGLKGEKDSDGPTNVAQFPRVDLVVNADGAAVDYSFYFQVFWQDAGPFKYASASLTSAAYREGDITLDGKKHRLILVDANSNGRFDDTVVPVEMTGSAGGAIYVRPSDALLVDPDAKHLQQPRWFSNGENRLSKLLAIDGRFYEAKVTAAGDSLTLTPSRAGLGQVTSPHEGLDALLYSDLGALRVVFDKSQPVSLPEGKWRLLEYTIDRTGWTPPPAKEKEKPAAKDKPPAKQKEKEEAKPAPEAKEGQSLLMALFGALTGSGSDAPATAGLGMRNGPTIVSATATMDCKAVQVKAGETVALPFGPPYKPVVTAFPQGANQARLQLAVVGAAGESCNNLLVQGGRPPNPKFTIKNLKGEVVQSGNFEYG
jgi:hypothetical protein